jgi:hypothetical protein
VTKILRASTLNTGASISMDLGKENRSLSPSGLYPASKLLVYGTQNPKTQAVSFEIRPCGDRGGATSDSEWIEASSKQVANLLEHLDPKQVSAKALEQQFQWLRERKKQIADTYVQSHGLSTEKRPLCLEHRKALQGEELKAFANVTRVLFHRYPHLNWHMDKSLWMPDFVGALAKLKELLLVGGTKTP